jgi:antitoxin Phd
MVTERARGSFDCHVNRRYRLGVMRSQPAAASGPARAQNLSERSKQSCTNTARILYNKGVTTMKVSEAREKLAAVIDAAQSEAVVLERYGQPAAVLVSMERYEELLDAFEEVEDVAAFDAAMAEEGENIPWEQVKADLGWS